VLPAISLASAGWTLGRDLVALRRARHAARAEAEGCGDGVLPGAGPPPSAGEPSPGAPGGADLG